MAPRHADGGIVAAPMADGGSVDVPRNPDGTFLGKRRSWITDDKGTPQSLRTTGRGIVAGSKEVAGELKDFYSGHPDAALDRYKNYQPPPTDLPEKADGGVAAAGVPNPAPLQIMAEGGAAFPGDPAGDGEALGEAMPDSGLLHSAVAGRTDHLKVNVPSGGYVVPADIVSGIGEGNTMAGARILQSMFNSGPYGVPLPKSAHHKTIPSPPRAHKAEGGATHVPILGAGGEFVIAPHHIAKKFGSLKRGHAVLDKWVVNERKKIAQEMLNLPGPQKD